MWGIIPAAGAGSRVQPLAFSKELLPVGCRLDGTTERARAVSEYIIDRMIRCDASGSPDKAGAVKDLWGDMAKKMVGGGGCHKLRTPRLRDAHAPC